MPKSKEIKLQQWKRKTEDDYYEDTVDTHFQNLKLINKVECYEKEFKKVISNRSKMNEKVSKLNDEFKIAKTSQKILCRY